MKVRVHMRGAPKGASSYWACGRMARNEKWALESPLSSILLDRHLFLDIKQHGGLRMEEPVIIMELLIFFSCFIRELMETAHTERLRQQHRWPHPWTAAGSGAAPPEPRNGFATWTQPTLDFDWQWDHKHPSATRKALLMPLPAVGAQNNRCNNQISPQEP